MTSFDSEFYETSQKAIIQEMGSYGKDDVALAVVEGIAVIVDVATGSTASHLYKLRGISQNDKRSKTLTGWIDLLIKMKTIKTAVRGTPLTGAVIPIGALQAVTGVGVAAAKPGIKEPAGWMAISDKLLLI
jgi:hypothetical protein